MVDKTKKYTDGDEKKMKMIREFQVRAQNSKFPNFRKFSKNYAEIPKISMDEDDDEEDLLLLLEMRKMKRRRS